MGIPEKTEKAIIEVIDMMNKTPTLGAVILKEQVEQILREAGIKQRVAITEDRCGYGVHFLAEEGDYAPFYLEETGKSYFFPAKSCPFCRYCGDLLYDFANGPYSFFCELGLDDPDFGGMEGKCREFMAEDKK